MLLKETTPYALKADYEMLIGDRLKRNREQDEICEVLAELWKEYPDFKLGEFMYKMTMKHRYSLNLVVDKVLLEILRAELRKKKTWMGIGKRNEMDA